MFPSRAWRMDAVALRPTICDKLEPTATVYGIPNRALSMGVSRKPPPTPKKPESIPITSPRSTMSGPETWMLARGRSTTG